MDFIEGQDDQEKQAPFYIRAQAAQAHADTTAPDVALGEVPSLRGWRILMVEDESDLREFFTLALQQYGASVAAVGSAAEALEALRQLKPNILISDISMPEEDGYTLIRKVRALAPDQGGLIPAVALTAFTRLEDRQRALSAGYHMHLSKTVTPVELARIIADLSGWQEKGTA